MKGWKTSDILNVAKVLVPAGIVIYLLWLLGHSPIGWILPTANAGEAVVSWTAPTKNCDGTDLTNLSGYQLQWGQDGTSLPAASLTYTITGLRPGGWWFSVAALSAAGERSEFVTVTKEIVPADFKTVAPTVYTLVKATDRFLYLPVGTIPLGVVCDHQQPAGAYFVVPRGSVQWSGTTRPVVVVASCG